MIPKQNYPKIRSHLLYLLFLLVFTLGVNPLYSQVFCDTEISLSLDPNCEGVVSPNTFLASDVLNEGLYAVSIQGLGTGPTVTVTSVGTYLVSIIELATNNFCGPHTLIVNDELGPVINCSTLQLDCGATVPTTPPTALDGCCGNQNTFSSPFVLGNVTQINDFDGPFSPANWQLTFDAGAPMENVSFNGAGTTLTLLGDSFGPQNVGDPCNNPNPGNPLCYTATACIDVSISGTVSFDWTNDRATGSPGHAPDFDPTAYSITPAGGTTSYTVLSNATTTSGTVNNLALNAGDQFCFIIGSNGFNSFSEAVIDNFSFQPVAADPCAEDYLLRRWTATDCNGATSSCIQAVVFNNVPTSIPTDLIGLNALDCASGFAVDANGNPDPSVTGLPQGCNISYAYTDEVVPNNGCQGGTDIGCYVVLRRWAVVESCTNTKIIQNQSIQVSDRIGPTIEGVADATISTSSDGCEALYYVPAPILTDNCSDLNGYTVHATAGNVFFLASIQRYVITDLPLGIFTLTYRAEDCCGNATNLSVMVSVEDLVPPNVTCETFRNTTLLPDGTSRILAPAFDDGSFDGCSPSVWFKVLRVDNSNCADLNGDDNPGGANNIWFDDDVFFCCADVGDTVLVTLRVFDVDPGSGPVSPSRMNAGGNLAGHFNECTTKVIVTENFAPLASCPPDITISCEFWYDHNNLSAVFGDMVTDISLQQDIIIDDPSNTDFAQPHTWGKDGLAYDNCGNVTITRDSTFNLTCGSGTIVRIFTVTDASNRSASCVQRITVKDFNPYFITDTNSSNANPNDGVIWPAPYNSTLNGNTCASDSDASVTGRPTILNDDVCAQIVVDSIDASVVPDPNSCIVINRTWIVTDLCHYPPPVPNPSGNPGQWQYTQLIRISDTAPPVFATCEDITVEALSFDANCNTVVTLSNSATDNCVNTADLTYTYAIDFNNTATSGNVFEVTGNDSMFTENLPLGTHVVVWKAQDRCGNVGECVQLLTVEDKLKPTAKAFDGLALNINLATDNVELMAMMVNNGSTDLCGSIAQLLLNYPALGPGQNLPPATAATSVIFDCSNTGPIYPDTVQVDFWVQDLAGNWDYVSTNIVVQDNNFACTTPSPSANIEGSIENENGASMRDVKVAVGDALFTYTQNNGTYLLSDLDMHEDYQVTPKLDVNFRDGITALDLVMISRHLLGIQAIASPYKIIAADVDNDRKITSFDIVELQKLILHISDRFANNTSWRFVDAAFTFPDPADPFSSPFPEIYNIPSLENDMTDINFIALKVGDITGNAGTNISNLSEDRKEEILPMVLEDQVLEAGKTYTLDFRASHFSQILGYQLALGFDTEALEYLGFNAGKLPDWGEANIGENMLENGIWMSSWAQGAPIDLEEDALLFQLKFKAKQNTSWRMALWASNDFAPAEAYQQTVDQQLKTLQPQLYFGKDFLLNVPTGFSLFPNRPNPFKEETLLSFFLPEAGNAKLTVYDPTGRILQTIEQFYSSGYHEQVIRQTDLGAEGILFVQLETTNHIATRKMVLLR